MAQFLAADFERGVVANLERGDARGVEVETNDLAMLAKFRGQRLADVAEPTTERLMFDR